MINYHFRMLLELFLFVPSLMIHFGASSFTLQVPKTSVRTELPLLRLGVSPLKNGRDRRMTHWESRSHSSFDDEDRNYDRGQISYSSILEEPSLLRIPPSLEAPEKSTSRNFDVTRDISNDQDPRFDRCIIDVIPSRPIVPWLLFSRARKNLDEPENSPLEAKKYVIPRCRQLVQGLSVQEPYYVEEPGWILVATNSQDSQERSINNEDPFYVARGKRSLPRLPDERPEEGKKSKSMKIGKIDSTISLDYDEAKEFARSTRKKRYAIDENLRKYLLKGTARSLVSSRLTERTRANGYVHRRNKHSDILDILNEPFFISRGKKDSMEIKRSETDKGHSRPLANFGTRRQILDTTWQPRERKKNCDSRSANCSSPRTSKPDSPRSPSDSASKPFRDRRGVMEELLQEPDLFYVARGKRSPGTRREFNKNSELLASTEITNNNLFIG